MLRASRLQFNAVDHCNLKCAHCSHSSPLLPAAFQSPEALEGDLARLQEHIAFDHISIVGGEPLLHPRIVDLARVARDSGIAGSVNMITNGLLLHRAPAGLWRYLNMLFVSAYPGLNHEGVRRTCDRLRAEQGLKVFFREMRAFQRIVLNQPTDDEGLVRAIFDTCTWKTFTFFLRDGHFFLCLTSALQRDRLRVTGIPYDNASDGVPIRGNTNLGADLARLLSSTTPLRACSSCLGSSGPWLPHAMLRDLADVQAALTDVSTSSDIVGSPCRTADA